MGSETRLIESLVHKEHGDGLPPLAYLPSDVNAVAEINGFSWSNYQRKSVEGWFPQIDLLEELLDHSLDVHYILNIRDLRVWIKSVDSHNDMRSRLTWGCFPGLPCGVSGIDEELISWVDRHHRLVQAGC